VRIVLALCWTVTFVLAKIASQPLLQRSATDSSGLWNSLKTCATLAFGGRFGRRSLALVGCLEDCSVRDFCLYAVWGRLDVRDWAVNGEVISNGAAV
jgi:hypothetical protein